MIKELNFLPGTRGQKACQEIVLPRGTSLVGIILWLVPTLGQFERTAKYVCFAGFPALHVACRTAGVAGGPSPLLKLRQSSLNRKYEELSYPKKSENVRPHSSSTIENATPL